MLLGFWMVLLRIAGHHIVNYSAFFKYQIHIAEEQNKAKQYKTKTKKDIDIQADGSVHDNQMKQPFLES